MTKGLQMDRVPEARSPVLVVAFREWSNAGDAPVAAVEYLMSCCGARRFGWFPAEELFHYSCRRPFVHYAGHGVQGLHLPGFEFFECAGAHGSGGLLVGIGSEPNLRWGPFCGSVLSLIRHCRVRRTILLGTQLVPRLHTAPMQVEGAASDPAVLSVWVSPREYRGPAGAIDALFHLLCQEGADVIGLWANVPNYLSHLRNPHAVHALLALTGNLGGLKLDFSGFTAFFEDFRREVEKLIENDRRVGTFVRRLQKHEAREGTTASFGAGESPASAQGVAEEIEEFLRSQGRDGSDEDSA